MPLKHLRREKLRASEGIIGGHQRCVFFSFSLALNLLTSLQSLPTELDSTLPAAPQEEVPIQQSYAAAHTQ